MNINQNNRQNEMIPVDYPASNPLILSPSQIFHRLIMLMQMVIIILYTIIILIIMDIII